jgi:hypothetical protein
MYPVLSANTPAATSYNLTKSLRFRSSASAYMNRTQTTATNGYIWTWSAWVKRGSLNVGSGTLFGASLSGVTEGIQFVSGDVLEIYNFNGSAYLWQINTTQVFRDPSAWYHIVVSVDGTQATASNRVKLYVNGTQVTAFSTASYPAQNTQYQVNQNTAVANIGKYPAGSSGYFDGYMAEVNFIDGQALTPSSFGSTNSTTGVWQPARYTGTYGTNGFYLPFTNTTSTTTLGYDSSGNGNNWTTNNISLTTGSTYDSMTDVPTLTSATTANYCVLNVLGANQPVTISNGNLTVSCGNGSTYGNIIGSMAIPSTGKYYFEAVCTSNAAQATWGLQSNPGSGTNRLEWYSGTVYYNGTSAGAATYAANDVLALAIDVTGGTIGLYKNGTLQNTITYNISALTLFPYFGTGYSNTIVAYNANFGQQPFAYTPPTGYVSLNTYNLPDSTIVKGNTVMDATLYTGTGSSLSVTNTASFKPDLVWLKSRSAATDHKLTDSVRGTTKAIISNSTAAETTDTNGLTAFNSNGFALGTDTTYNNNAATYVGWQWQAGQGTTSSNTNGSITSTVSVNASAGFSIATCTTPSSGTATFTVGHGLGVAPAFIIVKSRNTVNNWTLYHQSTGATGYLLFTTAAFTTNSDTWANTAPTSSVWSSNTNWWPNSANLVAYCWSEIAGFSKFGSYTGNGSTDGPFVYLGFRPKFLLIKRTDSTADWFILDTSRDTGNVASQRLYPDLSQAEDTAAALDIVSNGFKLRISGVNWNASGGTYIYMAFAENPLKYALAR